ncbi:hypothetical protein GGR57DRAFT_502474 [Xylariaceae sp. FL1272]|nr:hypothetical protein GGR57DRAFT_502474 [Xylariaceae sp. FL1272]
MANDKVPQICARVSFCVVLQPFQVELCADPKPDVYASPLPPTVHDYSAPIPHAQVNLSDFHLASTELSSVPTLQFDQGGFLFTAPAASCPDPEAEDGNGSPGVGQGRSRGQRREAVAQCRRQSAQWLVRLELIISVEMPSLGTRVTATLEMKRYKNTLMVSGAA